MVHATRPPRHLFLLGVALLSAALAAPPAHAQETDEASDTSPAQGVSTDPAPNYTSNAQEPPAAARPARSNMVRTLATPPTREAESASRVTREELEIRQPRSTPDALRYEPGVFVQQTAHSQGSAFIRGRTGQQTVLLFDDVRLNNSLFRQGPNQYFFTIDSRTVHHIDVQRGAASTRFGSDAIAGVLRAVPIEPRFELMPPGEVFRIRPRATGRYASADGEKGGRASVDAQFGRDWAALAGVGYRSVGLLKSGGPVYNPSDGALPEVPRFAEDGKTQLGTGFKELTMDLRVVGFLSDDHRLTLAAYDYRQFDAPRTDQCAPPYAPFNECLTYDEQFRTLAYATLASRWGWAGLHRSRITVSVQRQHERRTSERPSSFVINGGRDDVTTLGLTARALTRLWRPLPGLFDARLEYGVDVYRDAVSSAAWLTFTDLDITRIRSRGQYIEGSRYLWGGAFAQAHAYIGPWITARAGGRWSLIQAQAPEDVESGTLAVDRTWAPLVGNLNLEVMPIPSLAIFGNLDQGYRAPNLDDMTSRQRTGPGFQIENAGLDPEHGLTRELGVRWRPAKRLEIELWAYRSTLDNAIARASREADACPPNTLVCNNAWSRLQLVNLPGRAVIQGYEGSLKLRLPYALSLSATIAYTWGDGPNPQPRPESPDAPYEARVPLSRIPPLNGTAELLWKPPWVKGLYTGAGLRWATLQDRLAVSDRSDGRIPIGGTPGFAVLDLRAGYRYDRNLLLALVFENVTDEAYRYHGSSVNGPGRGLIASLELGY